MKAHPFTRLESVAPYAPVSLYLCNACARKNRITFWITGLLLSLSLTVFGQASEVEQDKSVRQNAGDSAQAKLFERARNSPKDTQLAGRLIGTKAPEWQVKSWVNSPPLQLGDLAGKVVLVRWFTEGCPFCSATAPALNRFYQQYHEEGLEVIGFYHHKSKEPLDVERVHRYAQQLKFNIPVAIDYDWQTLKNWWLDQSTFRWTSISFLIDRQGNIQYVHPGGLYVEGDEAYKALHAKIEQLLAEPTVAERR
jgi:peroxiredoxin